MVIYRQAGNKPDRVFLFFLYIVYLDRVFLFFYVVYLVYIYQADLPEET